MAKKTSLLDKVTGAFKLGEDFDDYDGYDDYDDYDEEDQVEVDGMDDEFDDDGLDTPRKSLSESISGFFPKKRPTKKKETKPKRILDDDLDDELAYDDDDDELLSMLEQEDEPVKKITREPIRSASAPKSQPERTPVRETAKSSTKQQKTVGGFEHKSSVSKNTSRVLDDDTSYTGFKSTSSRAARKSTSKITEFENRRKDSSSRISMEVCVIRPTSMESSKEIVDTLLSGAAVFLNLEGLDLEIAQRIIDFTAGACYSVDGDIQKASSYGYMLVPSGSTITGAGMYTAKEDTMSVRAGY